MPLPFPALKGFDGLAQNALVRIRPERVGFSSDDLKGKTLADHGLAQKETHRTREIKSRFCEELVGIATQVGINKAKWMSELAEGRRVVESADGRS